MISSENDHKNLPCTLAIDLTQNEKLNVCRSDKTMCQKTNKLWNNQQEWGSKTNLEEGCLLNKTKNVIIIICYKLITLLLISLLRVQACIVISDLTKVTNTCIQI